jgi:hypothetical protein
MVSTAEEASAAAAGAGGAAGGGAAAAAAAEAPAICCCGGMLGACGALVATAGECAPPRDGARDNAVRARTRRHAAAARTGGEGRGGAAVVP